MINEFNIEEELLMIAKEKICAIEFKELEEGLGFNIFRVLDRFDDEEKGHSAFLAALLNPKGRHGHNNLFLKLFIECLIEEDEFVFGSLDRLNYNLHSLQVTTEFNTRNGRLDIFARNNELAIAIENKIYASDQLKQLQRYKEYLNALDTENILIYLTLYGDEPSLESKGNLKAEDYYCISYDFISNWLNRCILNCNLNHIKSLIEQYKQCVDTLTGKAGTTMSNELSNLILKDGNLAAAIKLSKTIDTVKVIVLDKFFKELEIGLIKLCETINSSSDLYSYKNPERNKYYTSDKILTHYVKKNRNKPRYFGYVIKIYRENTHIANLEIRLDSRLYFVFLSNDSRPNLAVELVDMFCKTAPNINVIENMTSNKSITDKILFYPIKDRELNFQSFNNNCTLLTNDNILKQYVSELLNEELSPMLTLFAKIFENYFSNKLSTDNE